MKTIMINSGSGFYYIRNILKEWSNIYAYYTTSEYTNAYTPDNDDLELLRNAFPDCQFEIKEIEVS